MKAPTLDIGPIVSSVRRARIGPLLVALQVAVALAMLANALFIVRGQFRLMARSDGIDVANLFVISNDWTMVDGRLRSRTQADVAALRALPGVTDAFVTNSYPFENRGWAFLLTLRPQSDRIMTQAATYFGDEEALRTLGLHLIAGRNFEAGEIENYAGMSRQPLPGAIVSRGLAAQLAPGGRVLGQILTMLPASQTAPIIGIVDGLQAPWPGAPTKVLGSAVLLPYRFGALSDFYVVRTRPGSLAAAMRAAPGALLSVSRTRLIEQVQALSDARRQAFRGQRGLVLVLALACIMVLVVSACGVVGLTSYWVEQRHRQIGIRRALGATRWAILRYLQTENLLIGAVGAILGVGLGAGANLWMVHKLAMARLPVGYLLFGAALMLVLGQFAVFRPAVRASMVPPAIAVRKA